MMEKINGNGFFYLPIIIILLLFTNCKKGEVDAISLTETNKYLSIGDSLKLGYTKIEPEDKDFELIWTSSNKAVAIVDDKGLVRAISEGRTIITATSGKKSAGCEINVVTYSFKNAVIFDSNEPSHFYFTFSTNALNAVSQENSSDILLVLDMVLPTDSTNIVIGNYSVGNDNSTPPYFYSGQRNPGIKGSYLVKKATNDTLLVTNGKFTVSTPDNLYFILGELEVETDRFSFIYEGRVPTKNIPIVPIEENEEEESEVSE